MSNIIGVIACLKGYLRYINIFKAKPLNQMSKSFHLQKDQRGCHDTEHKDTNHSDTQHDNIIFDTQGNDK